MEHLIAVLFAIATFSGLALASMEFMITGMRLSLVLGHGIFAAAGLIMLIMNVVKIRTDALMNASLFLIFIVIISGFTLFSIHLMKKRQPIMLIVAHGLVAIFSWMVVVIATF